MKYVSIVIVNWNGIADTSVCLDSIRRLDNRRMQVETIVVDNGSTDDSVSVISKNYPWVRLISTGRNLGFTGGNNIGMEYARKHRADYIWLVNNDTLLDKNALCIVDAFVDASVGIAGSKIYFAPGREYHRNRYTSKDRGKVFWYAGGIIDWDNMYASHRGVDEVDRGQYDLATETPFITGCSMMIHRSLTDKIGLLDAKYYLYLEDVDYSFRAKHAGYTLLYYPKSVVWHVNAGSSGVGNPLHEYYQTRNRLLVGARYAPLRTKIALLREAVRFVFSDSVIKRRAVLDALFYKWGEQYEPKKTNN